MTATKRRRATGVADILIADDGDFAISSGANSSTHTFNSVVTSLNDSIAFISWTDTSTLTISSATWGGNACSILVQVSTNANTRDGCAIIHCPGAQTGNLVINWSAACDTSSVTAASLSNLQSATPVDTDSDSQPFSVATAVNLDALLAPGAGGIKLCVYTHFLDTTALTWTNATEISDLDGGNYRHSAAYSLDNDAAIISTNGPNNTGRAMCGVSLR